MMHTLDFCVSLRDVHQFSGVLYDSEIAWTDLNNTETEKDIVYIPYGMGENEPFALIEKSKSAYFRTSQTGF